MTDWVNVLPAEELKPSAHTVVEIDDLEIVIFNLDGEFFALEDLCSHEHFPLSEGDVEDGSITCALHGAEFCIKTGKALTAPAYEPVAKFPVRVEMRSDSLVRNSLI